MKQLAKVLECEPTWIAVKGARRALEYSKLCEKFMDFGATKIQCLMLDDGLGEAVKLCESLDWHDRFTKARTRRIVRIEVLAQVRLFISNQNHIQTFSHRISFND